MLILLERCRYLYCFLRNLHEFPELFEADDQWSTLLDGYAWFVLLFCHVMSKDKCFILSSSSGTCLPSLILSVSAL